MKTLFISACICFSVIACKSKKEAASATGSSQASAAAVTTAAVTGANTGKVSHRYRTEGCATVVLIIVEDGSETILIPKDKLPKDLDQDGQWITFNYIPLKMPMPEGCTAGMPAELSDINKK
jgi:hypothetical protein